MPHEYLRRQDGPNRLASEKSLFFEIGQPDLSKLPQVPFQFGIKMNALAMLIIPIHFLIQTEIIIPE